MDDECLADENSAAYVERFVGAARRYAGNARGEGGTKNVMFLMGSDFQYENADAWLARAARSRPRAVMVAVGENLRKE